MTRPIPTRPTPNTPTIPKVDPKVDPEVAARLKAAQSWQARELAALEQARGVQAELVRWRPEIYLVPAPLADPPAQPVSRTFRQRLTIRLVREDGGPLDRSVLGKVQSPLAALEGTADTLEFEGPRVTGRDALQLEFADGWATDGGDNFLVPLESFPGSEVVRKLPPGSIQVVTPKPTRLTAAPLFNQTDTPEKLRGSRPRPVLPREEVPLPGTQLQRGMTRLRDAGSLLTQSKVLSNSPGIEERRRLWLDYDRVVLACQDARALLQAAIRDADARTDDESPAKVLGKELKLTPEMVRSIVKDGLILATRIQAQAEWKREEVASPADPSRDVAIATLSASELSASDDQLENYRKVAAAEKRALEMPSTRELPVPREEVTHHLTETLRVRRTRVSLRIPAAAFQEGDTAELDGNPVSLEAGDGQWRLTLPRAQTKGALKLQRRTPGAELMADVPLDNANPYALGGHLLPLPTWKLVKLRTATIAQGPEPIALLEELLPVGQPSSKLADERKRAARDGVMTADGAWWIGSAAMPLRYRVRPSPFGAPSRRSIGDKLAGIFRKVTNEDRDDRVTGLVLVDAIRMEGPFAGHVAGVRVGAPVAEVEQMIGGVVPSDGVARYLDGALEIGTKSGAVSYLEIRRDLQPWLAGRPIADAPGTANSFDIAANRLRVPIYKSGFNPPVGAELEIWVKGRALPAEPEGGKLVAVVTEVSDGLASCKVTRKDRFGKAVGEALFDQLRSLPAPETGSLVLKSMASESAPKP